MENIQVRGGFEIGGDKAFIIADIGSNHRQDLTLAKESIDAAAESGANAIKFQSIQLDELYHQPDQKTASFIKKLEFPEEWHFLLNEYCSKKGVLFFSSPTYMKSVDLLESIDVGLYKLASAQVGTFPQIVEKVAQLNKPTIFSTGIAGFQEIIKAVSIFEKYQNNKYIILHCNSIYPTPVEKVNLSMMDTYRSMFGQPVGFSDHTDGIHIACSAVALGAKVIEKHFTLNRQLATPDCNSFASDPEEFAQLVKQIRDIEKAKVRTSNRISIQSEEKDFKDSITYRIFAKNDISIGQSIHEDDLEYLRFSKGINCVDYHQVIGKTSTKNILKGEFIDYGYFK